MCGIAGFYSSRNDKNETINNMLKWLQNRGPDGCGLFFDNKSDLVLGHRRLSILDLTTDGTQPMMSSSGRYVISFNGEIYNYADIKMKLALCGRKFKTKTDTEVLLESIEEFGVNKTLENVKGMFAIALFDRDEKLLYLIRDRFGEKPLYYSCENSELYFSSDIRSINDVYGGKLSISSYSLSEYFKYGYIGRGNTIYEEIKIIQPGEIGIYNIEDKSFKKQLWWNYEEIVRANYNSFLGTMEEAETTVKELLKKAIGEQLISSDVPVGAYLSGGIDSSLICALASDISSEKIKTYTIGFDNPKYNEANEAREVAKILGTSHHEMIMSENDCKSIIFEMMDAYSEPFADVSMLPTMLVSKFAKKDVTVVLSGDGGDELFGGYTRYVRFLNRWRQMQNIPYLIRKTSKFLSDTLPIKDQRFIYKMDEYGGKSELEFYDHLAQHSYKGWKCVNGGGYEVFRNNLYVMGLDMNGVDVCMYNDMQHYLPDDILTKVDRAGMYYSLENRIPMLDRDLSIFASALPTDYKIDDKHGKIILRNILKDYIPEEIFQKPKSGFSPPIGEWIRNDRRMREWAEELLNPVKIKQEGLLNEKMVRVFWEDFKKHGTNLTLIWSLLMFEQWYAKSI